MVKVKDQYDKDGRWVQERMRIKGAIRRAFRVAPQMREALQEVRKELPPALKKDGTPGKRPQVRYKCAMCGEYFNSNNVQVDHINTVVPLWKSESKMPFEEWVATIARGIFCSKDNLQVLCSTPLKKNGGKSSCHKKKTDLENYTRRELANLLSSDEDNPKDEWLEKNIQAIKETYQDYLDEKAEKERLKDERRKQREARKRKKNPK